MPEHVNRDRSKKAIDRLIKDEEEKIKALKQRKAEREKDHRPTDDLDRDIQNQEQMIKGKEEVRDVVDGFGQVDTIDKLIEFEKSLLADGKKELQRLRGLAPKPQAAIDTLARLIERLEKEIQGKEEAKGALVF